MRDFNETKGAAEAWNFWENDSIQKSHTQAKKLSIVGFRSFCLSKILTDEIVGTIDKLYPNRLSVQSLNIAKGTMDPRVEFILPK